MKKMYCLRCEKEIYKGDIATITIQGLVCESCDKVILNYQCKEAENGNS